MNVIVDGRTRGVRPDSIEVLRAGEVAVEELEASDPIVGDADWPRVVDIDQAKDEGLRRAAFEEQGWLGPR